MDRALRRLFYFFAVLCASYAGFTGFSEKNIGGKIYDSKTFWVAVFAALFFLIGARRFGKFAKFNVASVLFSLALIEIILQTAAWLGVLPFITTKARCPFGRVYWAGEGRGNSIRNRYGWYFPEFDLSAPHRVAFIGDSLVEAVEVHRTRNQAALLHNFLKQKSPDFAVFGLGSHGASPAHYIEVLKYAHGIFSRAKPSSKFPSAATSSKARQS